MTGFDGMRVLVTGGTEVVRQGLHTMVRSLPIVREVYLSEEENAAAATIDIVIVSAPIRGEELKELAEQHVSPSHAKILVILPDHEGGAAPRPPDLPVDGVLLESELTRESLGDALSRMCDGQIPLPARFARELLVRLRDRPRSASRHFLTPRESQTLYLLAEGLSNKQIARRLGVSEHAAKRNVAGVLAKLNCANRAVAVAVAIREGLLDDTAIPGQER